LKITRLAFILLIILIRKDCWCWLTGGIIRRARLGELRAIEGDSDSSLEKEADIEPREGQ
jgi:hypothetical protein